MKNKINTAILVCLLLLGKANAQVTLFTSALNSSGSGGSVYHPEFGAFNVDWSLGEMALVNTSVNGNLVVTQGMLQPARDFKTSVNLSDIKLSIYPNPTMNISFADLTITNQIGEMEARVYNMVGTLVSTQSFNVTGSGRYRMDFSPIPSGMYMLSIRYATKYSTDVRTQTYKLTKLN